MYSCCCYKYKVLILPSTRFFESVGSSLHHFIYNGVNKCTSHFIFVRLWFTALFTNMWILKFKSQLTIAFFAAVNHLNGPLRKQNFTLTGSKVQGLWFVIGGFQSVLCVSVFQGSLIACDHNYDWRQRKTQLWRRLLNSRVCVFVKSAVRFQAFCFS